MDTNKTYDEFMKLYQLHRDRVVQEDALIDRRMTWMLRLQGMLFFLWGAYLLRTCRQCFTCEPRYDK